MINILSEDLQEAIIGIAYPFTKDSENNDGVEGDENLVQGSTYRLVRGPTGPNRSEILKILLVLVRSNPRMKTEPLGPEPTGFVPWIPHLVEALRKLIMGKFENENDEFYKWSRSIHEEV